MKNLLALLFSALAFTLVASAQDRTWVSRTGLDSNPCSRTAPCATFAGAIAKTNARGEINCVDAGDYGSLTIVKSITLDCKGTLGSISSSTNGIVISAGPNDVVTIRNLSIKSTNHAPNPGINYLLAGHVILENVSVSNFGIWCILAQSQRTELTIVNATLADCATGIEISSGSPVFVSVDRSRIFNTQLAVNASDGSRLIVRDSTISQNWEGVSASMNQVGTVVTVVGSALTLSSRAALSGAFILAFGNTFAYDEIDFSSSGGGQILTGSDNNNSGSTAGTTSGSVPKI